MFEFFLYCDPRFTAFGKLVGINPAVADAVQNVIDFFKSPFSQVINNELLLPGTDRARIVAQVLTFWEDNKGDVTGNINVSINANGLAPGSTFSAPVVVTQVGTLTFPKLNKGLLPACPTAAPP